MLSRYFAKFSLGIEGKPYIYGAQTIKPATLAQQAC